MTIRPSNQSAQWEQSLLIRAKDGDLDAFEVFVRALLPGVRGMLARLLPTLEDAEDVAQEAFVKAWRGIDRYDPQWTARAWVCAIARNLAIDHHRRRGVRAEIEPRRLEGGVDGAAGSAGAVSDVLDPTAGDPARLVERADERDRIWADAVRILGPDEAATLWLRYGVGASSAEIGQVLGVGAAHARVVVHRAVRRLAAALESGDGGRRGREAPGSQDEGAKVTNRSGAA